MRIILIITAFSLLYNSRTLAQEATKQRSLIVVEHKIDSLKALRALLKKKMIDIDNQINALTGLKRKIELHESLPSKGVFGIVTTDIHMKLTNGNMSEKIRAKSKLFILDYLPERKTFKVKHKGQIGYLSDSWIHQTPEIIQFKRNKTASSVEFRGQKAINTTTIVTGSLREQPSLSATEIIQIPPGSKITVHDWYLTPYFKVSFKGRIGYLSYGSIKLTQTLKAIVDKTRPKEIVHKTSSRENQKSTNETNRTLQNSPSKSQSKDSRRSYTVELTAYETKVDSDENEIIKLTNGAVVEITDLYIGYVGFNKSCVLFKQASRWKIWIEGKKAYNCLLLKSPSFAVAKKAEIKYLSEVSGEGAVLKMLDGSIYEVDSIDTIITSIWLGSSEVLIIEDYKLINLDEVDEMIQVQRLN